MQSWGTWNVAIPPPKIRFTALVLRQMRINNASIQFWLSCLLTSDMRQKHKMYCDVDKLCMSITHMLQCPGYPGYGITISPGHYNSLIPGILVHQTKMSCARPSKNLPSKLTFGGGPSRGTTVSILWCFSSGVHLVRRGKETSTEGGWMDLHQQEIPSFFWEKKISFLMIHLQHDPNIAKYHKKICWCQVWS